MTAREDEFEALVADRNVRHQYIFHVVFPWQRRVDLPKLVSEHAIAADPVDGSIAGGGQQPSTSVVRRALARPALGGDRKRLLGSFLGEVEVAEEADQCGEYSGPLIAECLLKRHRQSQPSRIAGHRGGPQPSTRRSVVSPRRHPYGRQGHATRVR